jgi:hypothetical protein
MSAIVDDSDSDSPVVLSASPRLHGYDLASVFKK